MATNDVPAAIFDYRHGFMSPTSPVVVAAIGGRSAAWERPPLAKRRRTEIDRFPAYMLLAQRQHARRDANPKARRQSGTSNSPQCCPTPTVGKLLEGDMRSFIIVAMMFVFMQGVGAAAPVVKTDPMDVPNADGSAEAEALMNLQEFTEKLQEAGFKAIEILPQAIVVRARDRSNKPVMMIFDTLTKVATVFKGPAEPETTGSGSSDADQFQPGDQR